MAPEQIEETRAWLTKAMRDLGAAARLLEDEEPLLDIVVYHCQQAMEKALKGFLTFRESPFLKTHALVVLVEQAAELDDAFEGLIDHAEELSPFAWRFRYPGDTLEPEAEDARRALARGAVDFVLQRLPKEVQP